MENIYNLSGRYAEINDRYEALSAELEAMYEEQAKVVAKYQARINRLARSVEFWKENFKEAMKVEDITKIGGPKTGHKFTIWVSESQSIDVDEAVALAPFNEKITELVEQLPAWVKISTGVNKTVLKKEETLPEGATRVVNQSIQIR